MSFYGNSYYLSSVDFSRLGAAWWSIENNNILEIPDLRRASPTIVRNTSVFITANDNLNGQCECSLFEQNRISGNSLYNLPGPTDSMKLISDNSVCVSPSDWNGTRVDALREDQIASICPGHVILIV